jgi:pyruvate kinase
VTRRAKIVCTLGPATASAEQVRALVDAGMDVARLNFSHGTHAEHAAAYRLVREAADATGRAVAVLADLQGPKIRLGRFADGPVMWASGEEIVITTEDVAGSHDRVSTTYPGLAADVSAGTRLLVDDGNIALTVLSVDGPDIHCRVSEGGPVSDHKGISLPDVDISEPALTDKDRADLRFALGLRVDLVALSFVRSPDDVQPVREVMRAAGCALPVIAKLEKPAAVDRLAEVVDAFDGLMVARGDLGVEMPLEAVPLVQKRAVQLARENAKPVIVATQMLESMMQNTRPTRAEASDVANAVLDGADAVMLSGETSVGRYPIAAARTMARIVANIAAADGTFGTPPLSGRPHTKGGAIALAAVEVGELLGAKALVGFTQSGDTVRRMARHRSRLPLLAFTPEPSVRSELALTWGVETFLTPTVAHTDEMVAQVQQILLSVGRFVEGDVVVIVAGSPPGIRGSTNALRVWRLGDELPHV